jgi:hypothetical protein
MVVITSGTKGQLMNTFDPHGIDIRTGKIEQQVRRSRHNFLGDIDAIAYGVEAWFEENTGYSENVTETTVEIARKLGVPENEIRKWVAHRSGFSAERVKVIQSLMQRVGASSPADRLRTRNIKRNSTG